MLSRFGKDYQKLNTSVHYDLKMDLSSYVMENSPAGRNIYYNLNAVSLHSGSRFGGHYTAYVVDNGGKYWNCNDSWVQ